MGKWRRFRLVAAGLAVALLINYAWQWLNPSDQPVSYTDYCRVQRGMGWGEVKAIFGGPPAHDNLTSLVYWAGRFHWDGCAGTAVIEFDFAGNVVAKEYLPWADWEAADAAEKERIRAAWRKYASQRYKIRD